MKNKSNKILFSNVNFNGGKKMNIAKKSFITLMAALTLVGCGTNTNPFMNDQGSLNGKTGGGLGGAALGALAGQLIGGNTKGTLIGAGIGALAGLGWGAYRDQQEAELRERLRNTDIIVKKEGNNLNLMIPGDINFAVNSAQINPNFYGVLNQIGEVLMQYPESRIEIHGHTDSDGSDSYNLKLSQDRAQSVGMYFYNRGVAQQRISVQGFGESSPVADNASAAGKAKNRRVEVKILPPAGSGY